MNNLKIRKSTSPVWIAIIVLIISVVIAVFASRLLYQYTVDLLTDNLRERLLTISITAAANIDAKDLSELNTEGDWKKPEWANVVNKLHRAKYSNDRIVFMYVFRKKSNDPKQMEFVADADSINPYANIGSDTSKYVDVNRDGKMEPEGPDKLQWPGQGYPEAVDILEAFEAYNGPLTSTDLYTDDYGTVMTGYAPIKDENDNTVAVLATDIKADDFSTITRQTLLPFIIFIAFLTFVISILTLIIIYTWKKYAKSLETVNGQLKVANEGQANLMHFMNHQIKGRLGNAKNVFAELLTSDYGEMPEEAKPLLQKGLDETEIGISYVTSILKGASAESGKLPYEMKSMDFKSVVEAVVEKQMGYATNKGLKLNAHVDDGDYQMTGDPLQLREAVKNLVDNSVNYTLEGSIDVKLSQNKGVMRLTIKDTGVGISAEDRPKLFKSGGRGAESLKVNTNATGYGLVFVKGVVEAHKGKVWVESGGKNKGSTFIVELPSSGNLIV